MMLRHGNDINTLLHSHKTDLGLNNNNHWTTRLPLKKCEQISNEMSKSLKLNLNSKNEKKAVLNTKIPNKKEVRTETKNFEAFDVTQSPSNAIL